MKIIDKIKGFFERLTVNRKYKKLTDAEIIEKAVVDEHMPVEKAVNFIEEDENKEKLVTENIDELSPSEVAGVLKQLPTENTVSVYKENEVLKTKLAKSPDKAVLKDLLTSGKVKSYEELYDLIESGINDFELVDLLRAIADTKNVNYDSEKTLKILGKQMALYIRKYENVLGGHVEILLGALETDEEKTQVPKYVKEECEIKKESLQKELEKVQSLISKANLEVNPSKRTQGKIAKALEMEKTLNHRIKNLEGFDEQSLADKITEIKDFEVNRIAERENATEQGK